MKNCPYCNGEIDDEAKKCKHCGEWINKNNSDVVRDFAPTLAFAFFFGFLGVHRFYTGYKNIGIAQLVLSVTLFGLPVSIIWSLVDTILICLNKYKNANGKDLEKYNKTFGIIILVLAVICFVFNSINFIVGFSKTETSNTQTGSTESRNSAEKVKKEDLEVIEHHICTTEFGVKAICGTLQNNTGRKYSYVQIGANFYDADGTQVGNNFDNANDLEPNGKLKFEIMIEGNNVKNYKITDVTGY